ncbi:hypothetical protein RVO63_002260 [Vibrio parahaemolyticus]|nr:hypothetical protein [Vibrio parahaemolyticus]
MRPISMRKRPRLSYEEEQELRASKNKKQRRSRHEIREAKRFKEGD